MLIEGVKAAGILLTAGGVYLLGATIVRQQAAEDNNNSVDEPEETPKDKGLKKADGQRKEDDSFLVQQEETDINRKKNLKVVSDGANNKAVVAMNRETASKDDDEVSRLKERIRVLEEQNRACLEKIRVYEERLPCEEVDRRKPFDMWNDGIFFPVFDPEDETGSAARLAKLLSSATRSIKICLYLSSYPMLETAIMKRREEEGIKVHVITDHDTLTAHNNHFRRWAYKGVPIRTIKMAGYLMHNKFIIIDDEALITGSLNWTKQGVVHNRESVVVTTIPRLVKAHIQAFHGMWIAGKEFIDPRLADPLPRGLSRSN